MGFMKIELFQKSRLEEDMIMFKLQGSLTSEEKCKTKLNNYCLNWKKSENLTFEKFCSESSGNKDQVMTEVCKRLLDRIKGRCKTMQKELEREKKDLKMDFQEYEMIKKKVEKGIKSTAIVSIRMDDGKQIEVVQKDGKRSHVRMELEDIGMMSQVYEIYLELNTTCQALYMECGFKEECSEYENVCKEIDDICKKLVPPERSSDQTLKPTKPSTIKPTITKTGADEDIKPDKTNKIYMPKMVVVILVMVVIGMI